MSESIFTKGNPLFTDLDNLDLCEVYCTCGTPDPYNLGHTESCAMSLPIDILREVEAICPPDHYPWPWCECTDCEKRYGPL